MKFAFPPAPVVGIPVQGSDENFPVHRIYCVGRNYADHAKEMGFTGREPPFFFMKPADAAFFARPGETTALDYPSLTQNLDHEIELVAAIGRGGRNIAVGDAMDHVFGCAVGLDMTRRDLQADMKKQGRPWSIAKGFDHSAPIGPIVPGAACADIASAEISLSVNGAVRQRSTIAKLMWSIPEIIAELSRAWELAPGDLIFTGTPEGVGKVERGDRLVGSVSGLPDLDIRIA